MCKEVEDVVFFYQDETIQHLFTSGPIAKNCVAHSSYDI
jgi:hypothetical protein